MNFFDMEKFEAWGIRLDKETKVHNPPKTIEVPGFRVSILEGWKKGEKRLPPEDDMSDEAFAKRHAKCEREEKQRKFWDRRHQNELFRNNRLLKTEMKRQKKKYRLDRRSRKMTGYRRRWPINFTTDLDRQLTMNPTWRWVQAIEVLTDVVETNTVFGYQLPNLKKEAFQPTWSYVNNNGVTVVETLVADVPLQDSGLSQSTLVSEDLNSNSDSNNMELSHSNDLSSLGSVPSDDTSGLSSSQPAPANKKLDPGKFTRKTRKVGRRIKKSKERLDVSSAKSISDHQNSSPGSKSSDESKE